LTPQEPGYAFSVNPATTQIQDLGTVATENVNTNNDSVTIMLIYSPNRELSSFAFDYDWDNDGQLDLPFTFVDSLGVRTLGLQDQVYGPTGNILSFTAAEVDSVSRKRNDPDRNDGGAWFGGNLTSAGDDYLLYEDTSVALPVTGAAMTPGDLNTGSVAQSPLVSLTGVVANPDGTITVTFDGPISQVVNGDGSSSPLTGSGVTISNTNGQTIPTVDSRPVISGIGTNSLTLSFTGSFGGGPLPAGNYQLNFVGNGMVGNGRAVDVIGSGAQVNSYFEVEFQVGVAVLYGDYNGDETVNAADYTVWRDKKGLAVPLVNEDPDASPGEVDELDYEVWKDNFGMHLGGGGAITILGGSGGVAFASESLIAQTEGVEASMPEAPDVPQLELAFAEPATTTLSAKAAGADAAFSRSAAGGGSAPFDNLLLAVARQRSVEASESSQPARGELGSIDEMFAALGDMSFGCSPVEAMFGHAV
jgi:hypothetical protein